MNKTARLVVGIIAKVLMLAFALIEFINSFDYIQLLSHYFHYYYLMLFFAEFFVPIGIIITVIVGFVRMLKNQDLRPFTESMYFFLLSLMLFITWLVTLIIYFDYGGEPSGEIVFFVFFALVGVILGIISRCLVANRRIGAVVTGCIAGGCIVILCVYIIERNLGGGGYMTKSGWLTYGLMFISTVLSIVCLCLPYDAYSVSESSYSSDYVGSNDSYSGIEQSYGSGHSQNSNSHNRGETLSEGCAYSPEEYSKKTGIR